jgi:para-nitrobenzyl esterase
MMSTPEKKYDFWKEVMKNTGAKTLEEFRAVPAEILFSEWKKTKGSAMSAVPVKDGMLIKDKPTVKKIPYMVGSTSHDMAPAILYQMTKSWAKKNDAYMWLFERMLPGDDKGAWHSSDLWYWFGTLKNCWRPMENTDVLLSEYMSTYLCNFVKNGNPNGDGLITWEKCKGSRSTMNFGDNMTLYGRAKMGKLIYNTLTTKPVGE